MKMMTKQNKPKTKLTMKCLNIYLSNNLNFINNTKITLEMRINNL